jgi:preprotein translocase subunit SecE
MQDRTAAAAGAKPKVWTRVKSFFWDSWVELKKVIWPSRQDVIRLTGLVIMVVLIIGFFMYALDQALAPLTSKLFEPK